ncbi:hypothetical protein TraAM80_04232 [Trypanosoma rangeli]|uniref:Uncharacterized protein n=1 Tax=Trypanosoma rangeli TaxID=5698 RepID=A0A422NKK2_TRYRA|nr:uncharacterized protein TraAM80_04232 [Trypanosoma rangeli]RNF05986.1 hypothetical protein TraAM80_04232 [Trypanosoma rangeli]|eukprot:RNF05986.1 hypothetical protein TraAM80_04232 [Trypanosoma rangeli]
MDHCAKREFGRNVTNAPAGKESFAGLQLATSALQSSKSAERLRRPQKRAGRGDDHEDAAHLATAMAAKRWCTDEEEVRRQSSLGLVAGIAPATSPARSASESASSIEACFDDDAVNLQESPSACVELLAAVEQSDTAVMAGLRCVGDATSAFSLSSQPSAPPPSPAVIPLLF